MDYSILVLDLDGTLTNSKKEISATNRDALLRAQQQGMTLVLASGRPTYGIAPLANQLQMDRFGGYILSYNGGEIIDWSTQQTLYAQVLPDEVVPVLYRCAKQHDVALLSYDGRYIATEDPDDRYVRHEAFLNKMQVRRCRNFLEEVPLPLPKCLIVGEPARLVEVEAELSLALQGVISVYRSEPFFLELVPPGIDKAQSLAVLLRHIGTNREKMVAIGDGYNDVSMIEFAGLGVAMANAQEPVRKAADRVTLSNDEDGVAAIVNELFLNV
ncbi:MAG: Cof-type HAD-IIB family hydrolase [Bacteroidaceae bacterium]